MIFPPAVSGAEVGYQIGHSVRLRPTVGAHLTRTFSAGDRRTWTYKISVKRSAVGVVDGPMFNAIGNRFVFRFSDSGSATDTIQIYDYNGSSFDLNLITTPVFRDTNGHYEILLAFDTNNATASDRVRLYVNGTRITSFSTATYPTLGYQGSVNTANQHAIGRTIGLSTYADCYISDIHFVDGQALDPSAFGETYLGEWRPKQYTGTYGANGFHLDFSDGTSLTTLGYDAAGSNDWTLNSVSLTAGINYDWMEDTPSNNFATFNRLWNFNTSTTLWSFGALETTATTGTNAQTGSTIPLPSSGKFYIEAQYPAYVGSGTIIFGVMTTAGAFDVYYQCTSSTNGIYTSGGVLAVATPSAVAGDIFSFACDIGAGTVEIRHNNTLIYTLTSASLSGKLFGATLSNTNRVNVNFGQRPFSYTPPTGYQKLCTANLSNTTITTSGSFTGNASADGPFVWLNGTPTAMTINGNAVTFATHADKLANGFKVRSSSASYNAAGSNTYSITTTGAPFTRARAQVNP